MSAPSVISRSPRRERLIGIALVVVSACGFGSGPLLAKPIYGAGVDWMTLLAWRFVVAALLTWAWVACFPGQRRALRGLGRRRIALLLGLGALYTGNTGTYFAGLETVSASLSALIVYIYPALVAVLTIRFGRRLEGRRAWIALSIASVGVALALGGIDPGDSPPLSGLVLVAASPVLYAIWIVLAARFSGERPDDEGARPRDTVELPPVDAETVPQRSPTSEAGPVAAVLLTGTAVAWSLAALGTGRPVLPHQVPAPAWLPLLAVGVFAGAVAVQAFYAGARRIGAAQASIVSTVEPLWTITLATLLLGEALSPVQLAGGALVLVGVVLAESAAAPAPRPSRPRRHAAAEEHARTHEPRTAANPPPS